MSVNIKKITKSAISRNFPAHSPLVSPKINTNVSSIGGTRLVSPAVSTVGVRSGNLVCANRASAGMGESQSDRRPKRQTKFLVEGGQGKPILRTGMSGTKQHVYWVPPATLDVNDRNGNKPLKEGTLMIRKTGAA
eukprot:450806_1